MIHLIDPKSRSDKLLLLLGSQLSEASADTYRAIIVWQKLVELETELGQAEKDQKTIPPGKSHREGELRIAHLKSDCDVKARELKGLYKTIAENLPSVPKILTTVIERLNKDYGEMLKLHNL